MNEPQETRPRWGEEAIGYALLFSCIVVWGITAVAFKVCTKPPTGVGFDPVFLTGLRFLIVAPCMALMIGLRQPSALRLQPGDWKRYIVFGFVAIVLAESLQPLALRYTAVANVTLLSHGTLSLFTALWALLLLKQRIAPSGWVGAALALVGVALVAAYSTKEGFRLVGDSWKGDVIALFRSVEHSCYLLMLSEWMKKRSALQVTVYNCVFGALWLLPYVVWKSVGFPWEEVSPEVWLGFFWSVVPTTLYGFLAWNWAMSKVGAIAATNMFYLMPVSAAFAAWWLLGETVRPAQVIGGIVIIIGVILLRWDALVAAGLIRIPERWQEWRGWLRLPWQK
ncbi:MAG: DMT family transporter [Armatimonadaceae bacterium]